MVRIVATLIALVLFSVPAVSQSKRVALVIGNSAYQHTPRLTNPKNDASDVAATLKARGFQVVDGFDLDKAAFDRKVRDFATALKGFDVGLFFYAGHGLQVGGQNYLVPIDARAESVEALEFEMVRLDVVHRIMERQTTTNILFLDACRDNPLARNLARALGTRSSDVGRGLAAVESGIGTLISFSTQPGAVALDGAGRNSPFAGSLVKHVSSSSDDLSAILIAVRNDVMKETQRKQVPWEHSSLTGRFYFGAAGSTSRPRPAPAQPNPSELERAAAFIKETEDQARLEVFIKQFGDTPYAEMARARLEALKKKQVAIAPPPSRLPEKREHAFDGTWEVTGTPDNCPVKSESWKWRHALQIRDSEIVVARGFIGKFGKVLADGNFKFSVQGARSPPQFGNFSGKLQADTGQGRYKYPDCSGERRDRCCSGTLFLKRS
jgi:hypothetical protein